jgi:hypothetical protein
MDRRTIYFQQGFQDVDFLLAERYGYEAIGLLAMDLLGSSTLVSGMVCSPSSPAALTVQISPGRIYSVQTLEPTAWGGINSQGGLPADTNPDHQILKQGLLRDTTTLSGFTPPGTAGQSINYLIEVAFSETDSTGTQQAFLNTQAPANPIQNNITQNRQDRATLQVKAGVAATTGSQVTPTADAGFSPLWVVTVANGQSTITSGNIAQHSSAPVFPGIAQLGSPVFTGTVNISQALRLGGNISPAPLAANQNDYNPTGLSTATILRLTASAPVSITGLAAQADGVIKIFENGGANPITLVANSASSAAANRFDFGADRYLGPKQSFAVIYDGATSLWRPWGPLGGATVAGLLALAATDVGITPGALASASAFISLTDAATVAWDTSQGFNATITLGGNRTIGAPTNLKDGVTYTLNLVQDATGSRVPTWNAIWDFGAAGTPTLQTTAGKTDKVIAQYNAGRGKLEAVFWQGV